MPPVYSQIALDIALRIARGDLEENTKIYGRSVMSSEYGVSPETIRRAMKLLEDMNIVEVRQNSGALIRSAQKAKEYVERFGRQNDIRTHQKKLAELLASQQAMNGQIAEVVNSVIHINEHFSQSNPFPNYEAEVCEGAAVIGRTLGDMMFWQKTAATVIAIRRDDRIILSPGPYAVLQAGDVVIFVGDANSAQTVTDFLSQ